MGLPAAAAARAQWCGLGPHEAYCDRVASARLGVFSAPVAELRERYVRPQENGQRMQPRWLLLRYLSLHHMSTLSVESILLLLCVGVSTTKQLLSVCSIFSTVIRNV